MKTESDSRHRDEKMRDFLRGGRRGRKLERERRDGEIECGSGGWEIVYGEGVRGVETVEKGVEDFLVLFGGEGNGAGGEKTRLELVRGDWEGEERSEDYRLVIEEGGVKILSVGNRGWVHGIRRLERMLNEGGGRWLPRIGGEGKHWKSVYEHRIANGVLVPGHPTTHGFGWFEDEYLALLTYYGVNGVHVYQSLFEIGRSDLLEGLTDGDVSEAQDGLRGFVKKMARYGIEVFPVFLSKPIPASHPVFEKYPEVRGGKVEIFVESYENKHMRCLCLSEPRVHQAYQECVASVYREIPDLGGPIFLIGGEVFFQCWTRSAVHGGGDTNCPRCQGKDAGTEIAELVNGMAKAVWEVNHEKTVMAWPYSAFVWASEDDPNQLRWVNGLDTRVRVLANIDCGDAHEDGAGARYFDYNVMLVDRPGTLFAAQRDAMVGRGGKMMAKTETNTTPDAFFLPYLAVHGRWAKRFETMREAGLSGFISQWRFFGAHGTPPEELLFNSGWDAEWDADKGLEALAESYFGVEEQSAAKSLIAIWKELSEAYVGLPYSSNLSGERQGYMKGPFYLGPAHPLIYDVQSRYDLPIEFCFPRGDAAESATPEEMERRRKEGGLPRYSSDLLFTSPYGVARFLQKMGKLIGTWEATESKYQKLLETQQNRRLEEDLRMVQALGIHFKTVRNTAQFYWEREKLAMEAIELKDWNVGIEKLQAILREEIANAERAIPLLQADFRIGYGHTYGEVYDEKMVRAKIEQCRYVLEKELPRVSAVIRFHVWLDYP